MSSLKLAFCLYPVVGVVALVISIKSAIAQGCTSYWVNPQTGKEECLNLNNGKLPVTSTQQSDDRPGYIKISETRNKDKIYIRAKSIRGHKLGRSNTVSFQVISFYGKIDSNGTVKTSTSYVADCDRTTLAIRSYYEYDAANEIINGMSYNATQSSRYQSTAPSPVQVVQPGTVGYSAWDYVCSQK
ncbi:hypothetical protein IQ231_18835 [Cuspidothrix issatschenkoi LEGE 03284]|uniref:surface-adhesin E family protein n=1 Tax=Cuspidothrix issatschenkoi TaxID=230752 RepID=UPI00187E7B08|nr:surface-adhesin E family protein [Cuspidothrix issatschenkoi]MBE9233668.1 hypothetical protein [Cuspidothrix issatschenkoi LEGE 03284]